MCWGWVETWPTALKFPRGRMSAPPQRDHPGMLDATFSPHIIHLVRFLHGRIRWPSITLGDSLPYPICILPLLGGFHFVGLTNETSS